MSRRPGTEGNGAGICRAGMDRADVGRLVGADGVGWGWVVGGVWGAQGRLVGAGG